MSVVLTTSDSNIEDQYRDEDSEPKSVDSVPKAGDPVDDKCEKRRLDYQTRELEMKKKYLE